MIEKPTIIVTSLGRTGTLFFATLFADIINGGTSLHEPDYLNFSQYRGIREKTEQVLRQIKESGAYNLLVRKILGKWSLIEVSDDRLRGNLSRREAVAKIFDLRQKFIETRPGFSYIESTSAYYGVIDVLPNIFKHHRIVYIVRDGRDWVRSKMDWGEMYGKGRVRSLLAHTWPTSDEMDRDVHRQNDWHRMSRFERICWAWATLNHFALRAMAKNPHARLFYFEDIFKSKQGYQHLAELISFAIDLPGVQKDSIAPSYLEGWLERKIHKSEVRFPRWKDWDNKQKIIFKKRCGELMNRLGYPVD